MSSSRINAALAPVCVCASRRHPVRVSARQRVSGLIPTEHAMGTELTGFNPKCRTTEMVLVNMHR